MTKSLFHLLLLLLSLAISNGALDYASSFYDDGEDPIPEHELQWKMKFNFTMEGADLDKCGPQTKKIILARVISGIDTYGTRYMAQNMGGAGEIALVPGSILRKGTLMIGNLYIFVSCTICVIHATKKVNSGSI